MSSLPEEREGGREGRARERGRRCEEVDQEGKRQMRQRESHVEAREMTTRGLRSGGEERKVWEESEGTQS